MKKKKKPGILRIIGAAFWILCVLTSILGLITMIERKDFSTFNLWIIYVFASILGYWLIRRRKEKDAAEEASIQIANAPFQSISQLPTVVEPSLILANGEVCHCSIPAQRLIQKEKVTGYTGGGAGVSVRIAKGITYRTGGSARTAIREKVTDTYSGKFILTNKRVIFQAFEHSFEKKLASVTSAAATDDGLFLQFGSQSYILALEDNTVRISNMITFLVNHMDAPEPEPVPVIEEAPVDSEE